MEEHCNQLAATSNQQYPAHGTQAARFLAAVLLGQKITPFWGWDILGIYRLSSTKHRLKNEMGWPIESGRLDVANKFSEACNVALYSLPDWAIEAAGEFGQKFAEHEFYLMARKKAA